MLRCAFDRGNDTCSALTEQDCMNCRFFKTEEEVKAGRKRARERIFELPESVRRKIIRTYYPNNDIFR